MCPENDASISQKEQLVGDGRATTSSFYDAICKGLADEAEQLLRNDTDVDLCSATDGRTALHAAIENADFASVELLMDHGADPRILTGGLQQSALHLAAIEGNTLIVARLLRDPRCDAATLELTDRQGHTALDCARQNEHWHAEQQLIQHGQQLADHTRLVAALKDGSRSYLDEYLYNGGSVNEWLRCGRTMLHYATEAGQFHMCLALLERGAYIGVADKQSGRTPLQMAYDGQAQATDMHACFRSFDIVLLLIRYQCVLKRVVADDGAQVLLGRSDMRFIRQCSVLSGYYKFYKDVYGDVAETIIHR